MAKYKLLSVDSDAKTKKGRKYGYLTGILYLAPATEANGQDNLCPMATDECRRACLYGAGMAGVFPSIKRHRIGKTLEYLERPAAFKAKLIADIHDLIGEAKTIGLTPAVRLNGTSDQPKLARELAAEFPTIQFYDYTKIPRPWKRTRPNYHVTVSFSGSNLAECMAALKHRVNVAVVFNGELPDTWHGYQVINGDASDLRFADPIGVIVGLTSKGPAKMMAAGGFIQIGG